MDRNRDLIMIRIRSAVRARRRLEVFRATACLLLAAWPAQARQASLLIPSGRYAVGPALLHLAKPFMVIKHDISFFRAVVPEDEAGRALQARVEQELSSVYLKGTPGYRVEIAQAKHMTFSDMAVLEAWADAARRRRLGVEDRS